MKLRGEILAILISASMLGCSQSKSTPQEKESLRKTIKIEDKYLKSILDDFFTQYKSSPNKAIEIIFQTNKDYINKEQVSQLTSRLDSTTRALGAYTGQKLIFEKNVGEDSGFIVTWLSISGNQSALIFTSIKPIASGNCIDFSITPN